MSENDKKDAPICWRSECRNGCYYPDFCSEVRREPGMSEQNAAKKYGPGWRLGPKPGDSLRTLRCLVTGHEWIENQHKTQRVCYRCWTVQDRPRRTA